MGEIVHSQSNYAHKINDSRLVYVNYAALIADTSVVDDQVGVQGLITDTNSFWLLEQVSPCIKWRQVSGRRVSQGDSTIYVNWDTGDDNFGNGSALFPFKSHRFLDDFYEEIRHEIRVETAPSPYYDYFPESLNIRTVGPGRLIFDSSGETFPVYAGPFTVTSVVPVGGTMPLFASAATDLVVAGAGWSVDDFYGKFIRMTSGAWDGYVLYLHGNTSDTITTIADWWGFAPGDTFEIVTEPVVITVDHSIDFDSNSRMHRYTADDNPDTPFEPSILICGFRFISSNLNAFRFHAVNMIVSACTFWGSSTDLFSINMNASHFSFNFDNIPAGSFTVPQFEDFYAFAWQSIPLNGNPVQPAALPCFIAYGPGFLSQISMRGELRSEKALGHFQTFGCQIGKASFSKSGTGSHEHMLNEQIGYDTPSFVVDESQPVTIVSAYCRHYQNVLATIGTKAILVLWLQGEDPLPGSYGADIGTESSVIVPNSANVTATGPLGDIIFRFPANETFSWPTPGTMVSNSLGTAKVIGDNTI